MAPPALPPVWDHPIALLDKWSIAKGIGAVIEAYDDCKAPHESGTSAE